MDVPFEELLDNQLMILSMKTHKEDLHEHKYLELQWSNYHSSIITSTVLDVHGFLEDSVKQPSCIVLTMGNFNITQDFFIKTSSLIMPLKKSAIWVQGVKDLPKLHIPVPVVSKFGANRFLKHCGTQRYLLTNTSDVWNQLNCYNSNSMPANVNVIIAGYV